MTLFMKLFQIINIMSSRYGIDESHGIIHSMNVLHYANNIYQHESIKYPELKKQENIIYIASVLHDMCDKKYVNESYAIQEIDRCLKDLDNTDITQNDIDVSKKIMQTMSYSTVKKFGYPDLKEYQRAYHIVREADLLSAYDFDRSMIYHIRKNNSSLPEAYDNACAIFKTRILRHNIDGLFTTEYAQRKSVILHHQSVKRMLTWRRFLKI
jgi:hypothetical protein